MKNSMLRFATAVAACAVVAGCGSSDNASRDQIRAVGSSTVYPFAKAVADSLAKSNPEFKSPIIESTGTGAGMKLFCAGVGAQHPDIANASRRIKKSEYDDCAKNAAKPFGKPNTTKTWKDVNPALPDLPILVYGPPSTSGTRDALKELILTKGCETDPAMKALKDSDKDKHDDYCTTVRSDGIYVDAGENDNLIVQKLEANPKAIGVFGFSYLEENADKLKGLTMAGVVPTYQSISDFSYPGARPLYIYVKAAHLTAIKGLKEFVAEWAKSWGRDGLLAKQGMVVAPDDALAASGQTASAFTLLDPSQLK
jgi:phosphate transport system substrate-binding protein